MSFTIPPDSPKAVKAAAFGRELMKACKARGVPLKELERATGVGHSSLDNYRRGLLLPKVAVAFALATALDAPRLATMIVEARTFVCRRPGCGRTFRNDTGAPRKYCSSMCQRINENLRIASRRRRQAGQTGSKRSANAAVANLRSGLSIADERGRLLESAIAAMCAGCEPEGVCRVEDCPLRPFSPLPLEAYPLRAAPRTRSQVFSDLWSDERKVSQGATMRAVHAADPTIRERAAAGSRARHAAMTPPQREAWIGKISATKQARSIARGSS